MSTHIGRSFIGNDMEKDCPCGKANCGLVDSDEVDNDCSQHSLKAAKTLRQLHDSSSCSG